MCLLWAIRKSPRAQSTKVDPAVNGEVRELQVLNSAELGWIGGVSVSATAELHPRCAVNSGASNAMALKRTSGADECIRGMNCANTAAAHRTAPIGIGECALINLRHQVRTAIGRFGSGDHGTAVQNLESTRAAVLASAAAQPSAWASRGRRFFLLARKRTRPRPTRECVIRSRACTNTGVNSCGLVHC